MNRNTCPCAPSVYATEDNPTFATLIEEESYEKSIFYIALGTFPTRPIEIYWEKKGKNKPQKLKKGTEWKFEKDEPSPCPTEWFLRIDLRRYNYHGNARGFERRLESFIFVFKPGSDISAYVSPMRTHETWEFF